MNRRRARTWGMLSWAALAVASPVAVASESGSAQAQPAVATPLAPAKPSRAVRFDELAIRGSSTEYDGLAHTYTVRGTVRIALRDLTVTCREAVIFTTPDEDRVVRIVFSGDVVAIRGRGTFRGDKVTYTVDNRKLVAEGNTRTRLLVPGSAKAGGTGSVDGGARPAREQESTGR